MNLIIRFFNWLFEPRDLIASPGDQAYLAGAVDINDLERRLDQLDHRPSFGPFGLNA